MLALILGIRIGLPVRDVSVNRSTLSVATMGPAHYIFKCLRCLVNHRGGLVVREAWYHMNDLSSTLRGELHGSFCFFVW